MKQVELVDIKKTYILEDKNSGKLISSHVLSGVSIAFTSGELHTVLGENGAGKSTLVHILSGRIPKTSGQILLDGQEVCFLSPYHAIEKGILIILQSLPLINEARVFEQLMLENNGMGFLQVTNKKRLKAELLPFLQLWGIEDLNLDCKIASLSKEEKFFLSLASRLCKKPKMLILDESSSLIPSYKRDAFFTQLKSYAKSENIAILTITHDIDEAIEISEKITVIRDGKDVASFDMPLLKKERTNEEIKARIECQMLKDEALAQLKQDYKNNISSTVANQLNGLSIKIKSKEMNFAPIEIEAKKGSITGLQFIKMAEMQEIEDALSGMNESVQKLFEGEIIIEGACATVPTKLPLASINPRVLLKNKIGFIPSDRYYRASHPHLSIGDILVCYSIDDLTNPLSLIDKEKKNDFVLSILKEEGILASIFDTTSILSGGQLQRIILSRCLKEEPEIIILAEPLRGLDVLSMKKLGEKLKSLASLGKTILILTQEEHNEVYSYIFDDVFRL